MVSRLEAPPGCGIGIETGCVAIAVGDRRNRIFAQPCRPDHRRAGGLISPGPGGGRFYHGSAVGSCRSKISAVVLGIMYLRAPIRVSPKRALKRHDVAGQLGALALRSRYKWGLVGRSVAAIRDRIVNTMVVPVSGLNEELKCLNGMKWKEWNGMGMEGRIWIPGWNEEWNGNRGGLVRRRRPRLRRSHSFSYAIEPPSLRLAPRSESRVTLPEWIVRLAIYRYPTVTAVDRPQRGQRTVRSVARCVARPASPGSSRCAAPASPPKGPDLLTTNCRHTVRPRRDASAAPCHPPVPVASTSPSSTDRPWQEPGAP